MNTKRGYQEIATRISRYIGEQGLKPGARLPGEHNLAKALGLCRSTVRAGLIALEIAGELEIRTGSGAYVCQPRNVGFLSLDSGTEPLEVLRARMIIEGQIAADAALYASTTDLAKLAKSLEDMRRLVLAGANSLEADRRFHLAVGEAARNSVPINIVQRLWDSMFSSRHFRLSRCAAHGHHQASALEDHEATFSAIAGRDPNEARKTLRHHLRLGGSMAMYSAFVTDGIISEQSDMELNAASSRPDSYQHRPSPFTSRIEKVERHLP